MIKFTPKEGWKIYIVDKNSLYGGGEAWGPKELVAKKKFGFADQNQKIPSLVFAKNGEVIPDIIANGLVETRSITFESGSGTHFNDYPNNDYYNGVKTFPEVQQAIQEKLEMCDPRLLHYSLGKIDTSVQNTWETKPADDEYGKSAEIMLLDTCADFKLFGVGGHTTESALADLRSGEKEIFTPQVMGDSKEIKEQYEVYEKSLDKFLSPINREIQVKRIEYLKKVYEYVLNQEDQLALMKSDPVYLEQYFAHASLENPLRFENTYEDYEKLNLFLKDKDVAFVHTSTYKGYSEQLDLAGTFHEKNLKHTDTFNQRLIQLTIPDLKANPGFSINGFASKRIHDALVSAGYTFSIRNQRDDIYDVNIPRIMVPTHVLKFGEIINGEKAGGPKVWYCGKMPVEVHDQSAYDEVKKIIDDIRTEEGTKISHDFLIDFRKACVDGITAVIRTGRKEKYRNVPLPERFIILAKKITTLDDGPAGQSTRYYDNVILDSEAIGDKKIIHIEVPSEMTGFVIGKGGTHVRELSELLGVRIFVNGIDPRSHEERNADAKVEKANRVPVELAPEDLEEFKKMFPRKRHTPKRIRTFYAKRQEKRGGGRRVALASK